MASEPTPRAACGCRARVRDESRDKLQPDLVPVECSVEIEIELNGYGDGREVGGARADRTSRQVPPILPRASSV